MPYLHLHPLDQPLRHPLRSTPLLVNFQVFRYRYRFDFEAIFIKGPFLIIKFQIYPLYDI